MKMGLAFCALLLSATSGYSQVVARFDGIDYPADTNGDINVTVGALATTKIIRVYDPSSSQTTLPTLSFRTLTISGTASTGARLEVLIASEDTTTFPPDFQVLSAMSEGVVNLGVPDSSGNPTGGIVFTDASLRAASVLAIAVSGDIHGNIDAGTVFRIQALGVTDTGTGIVSGGTINSTIKAYAADTVNSLQFPPSMGNASINVIEAYREMKGSIQAVGGARQSSGLISDSASVLRVQVSGNVSQGNALGLDADVLVPNGSIGSISCSGPIGTTRRVNITAGEMLGQVRTASDVEPISGSTPSRTLNANITAGAGYNTTTNIPAQVRYGKIQLAESSGDVTGNITAQSLGRVSFLVDGVGTGGILVRGRIDGNVTIQNNCYLADIVASSINGDVTIGHNLSGSIVAYGTDTQVDPTAGTIKTITIGRATAVSPQVFTTPYENGFSGSFATPIDLRPNSSRPIPWLDRLGVTTIIDDSIDATIYARYVDQIDISRMSLGAKENNYANYRPRIEVRAFGTMRVDSLEAGIIWSGDVQYDGDDVVTPLGEYYADGERASFGCVSPMSDIWVKGRSTAAARVLVDEDMRGQLRMPLLDTDDAIHIGLGSV